MKGHRSAEPAGYVILGSDIGGVGENFLCQIIFHQFPEIEKGRFIADPASLLHVMGDNDYGVLLFQFVYQLFDLGC